MMLLSSRRLAVALCCAVFAMLAFLVLGVPRASAATVAPPPAAAPAPLAVAAPAPIVIRGVFDLRAQPLQPGTQAVVRGDGDCLRMHAGADLSAAVITCVPDGSSVLVMPSTQVNGQYRWQLVLAGSTFGWVADQYLDSASAQTASACSVPGAQLAARHPGLSGQLPQTGIGAGVWGGGSTDGIVTAALAQGCTPQSIWAQGSGGGQLVGYLTNVPAWVNQGWQAEFPTGDVPPNTILFVVCAASTDHASVPLILAPATAPTRASSAAAPAIDAEGAVVIDGGSGEVLFDHNAHEQLAPASLTKMATAVVAIEGSESNQWVVNGVDSRTLVADGDSVMGLLPGDCFQMRDLVYGLLLPSGNDAALSIAQYVAGSTDAFVGEMNTFVRRLGLTDTSFTDPDGLGGPNHYSSAYDLAMIARYGMTLPLFKTVVGSLSWSAQGSRDIPLHTLNQFLSTYPGADGLKTGWTEEAGHTLAVSATRDGHRLIAVVLDDVNRYTDVTSLMDWAFSTFRWP
jgi:serine-type D-Ala-D-Ala carboxypeptidase (penicillin-binding protein 5/6)